MGTFSGVFWIPSGNSGRGLLLVLLLLFSEILLAQGTHPSCYYYPPSSCPAPPRITNTPVASENPSLDGNFQLSIVNTDPYSWTEWNTSPVLTGNTITINVQTSGTYTYSAVRCIMTSTGKKCSTPSPSVTVTVNIPPPPAGAIDYTYDALGRLIQTRQAGATNNYQYDAAGNRTAVSSTSN